MGKVFYLSLRCTFVLAAAQGFWLRTRKEDVFDFCLRFRPRSLGPQTAVCADVCSRAPSTRLTVRSRLKGTMNLGAASFPVSHWLDFEEQVVLPLGFWFSWWRE